MPPRPHPRPESLGAIRGLPKEGFRKDQQQSFTLLFLTVLLHFGFSLSAKSQLNLEEPASFPRATDGCMQTTMWPAKAIDIQKSKESGHSQAHFKPVHLKLKASKQPDRGTCECAVL